MMFCLLVLLPSYITALSLGTKTPYEYVRGDITTVEWDTSLEPKGIYILARHGSRHLGSSKGPVMTEMATKLSGIPLDWMKENDWIQPFYTPDSNLVPQGMLEHFHLGQRFWKRFGSTLFPSYYPTNYDIRATHYDR